jgi:hypothetical protein
MRRTIISSLLAVLATVALTGTAHAKRPYLDSVNNTCGTNYDCGLCHVDPNGGGALNADGEAFAASGYDPTYFCPGSSCIDGDGDGFGSPGDPSCSGGAATDCNDNNSNINPGVAELCSDTVDNDCDGKTDCTDSECTSAPVCQSGSAEVCNDGIDNDNDGKTDCADRRDCGTAPACSTGGGGSPEICTDGIDNDNDGKADCADRKDCSRNPACL